MNIHFILTASYVSYLTDRHHLIKQTTSALIQQPSVRIELVLQVRIRYSIYMSTFLVKRSDKILRINLYFVVFDVTTAYAIQISHFR